MGMKTGMKKKILISSSSLLIFLLFIVSASAEGQESILTFYSFVNFHTNALIILDIDKKSLL